MENKKNIVITFAPHARRWFEHTAIAAARAFKEIGHNCDVVACSRIDGFNADTYDIIFVIAPHTYTELNLTPNFVKVPGKIYIAWCLEQTPHIDKSCDIMNKHWQRTLLYVDKFDFFFTESEPKTQYVIQQGRQAFTATIGYHPHFTMYNKDLENAKKEYDVFFIGAMYPRRARIIQRLRELGLRMYPSGNDMFDCVVKANAVRLCRVGLNIHHNNIGYFEKPRIIQDYMSNKILVVSETIDHPERFRHGKHLVMAPYEKLADTVYEWCRKRTPNEVSKIVDNAFHYLSNHYTMKDSMKEILKIVDTHWNKKIKKFSGERVVPLATDRSTELQHKNRYEFFQSMAIEKSVLDVGCGTGYGSNLIAAVANKTIGIDVDETAVEHARSTYQLPKFGHADLLKLPYGKSVFDLIYCFEVIEHISDYQKGLREFARVLKKNGKLIISTPNKMIVSGGENIPRNEFHVKEWNLSEYTNELKKYFRKVITYGQPDKHPWPVHFEAKERDLFFVCVCTK